MASRSEHDQKSLDAARADTSFFGHPRGLATLFFTEMWERFSYYGMRAILIFYLTASLAKGGLGFADSKAGAIYGLYTAMVYLLCLGGGWIADLFTGQRRAGLYGGIPVPAGAIGRLLRSEASFSLGPRLFMFRPPILEASGGTLVVDS